MVLEEELRRAVSKLVQPAPHRRDPAEILMDIKLDGLNVMVGIPAGRDIPALTVKSLIRTFTLCQRMNIPCQLGMIAGNAVIQWARDEVVELFINSSANRLFWIDSDMVWEPEDFMRMLAISQVRDVVCATYPAKVDQPTFYVNCDKAKPLVADDLGLLEIWGVGLGFTVMRREVIEKLVAAAPKVHDEISGRSVASVFRVGSLEGKRQGEDMAFFNDIRALGYKVMLDPQVDLGHMGMKKYTGTVRDALQLSP